MLSHSLVLVFGLAGVLAAQTGITEARINYILGSDPAGWRTESRPLTRLEINPQEPTSNLGFVYSTYFGGTDREPVFSGLGSQSQVKFGGVAVDPEGCVYLAGTTHSPDLPVHNALQGARPGPGTSAFVAKFDPTGARLIYATYLGGSANRERGFDVAVNVRGEAYVVGRSLSADFPVVNALQPIQRGGEDGFLAKLSADGSSLIFSTFIGGSAGDDAYAVALDSVENIYLAGETSSPDFPVRNAYQPVRPGGVYDSWLAKLNANASAILFATYVGGNADDDIEDLAVDFEGNVFVTGYTSSTNFPLRKPVQVTYGGGPFDGFLAKFSPQGGLLASTFLGGSQADAGVGLGLTTDGAPVVGGITTSSDFPVSPGAYRASMAGSYDGFVVKLESDADVVSFATYFGGSSDDAVLGVAVDATDHILLAGQTTSADLPPASTIPLLPYKQGTDAFAGVLDPDGRSLAWFTYLGGSSTDVAYGVATDNAGGSYVFGATSSTDYPIVAPFQAAFGGVIDAFLTKIAPPPPFTSVSAASPISATPLAPGSIAVGFGHGLAPATESAASVPLPTALAETSIRITDSQKVERLAPLFFVSAEQVYYLIPEDAATGFASVTVLNRDQTVDSGTIYLASVSPGVFTANNDGRGAPAAIAVRYAADNSQTWDYVFLCGSKVGGCVPKPIDLGADTDRVYLELFGTGIRGVSSASAVRAIVGGVNAEVQYAGPQGSFTGLDQVNILLPRSLRGRGGVQVELSVDGLASNPVVVMFQ